VTCFPFPPCSGEPASGDEASGDEEAGWEATVVVCCVVLFLSCVCVCDLFPFSHPTAGCCSCRVVVCETLFTPCSGEPASGDEASGDEEAGWEATTFDRC